MIDLDFIEFYIYKKHNQKLEVYFRVNKSAITKWRKSNFPEKRLHEFVFKEGSQDPVELIKRIYKNS
jgi:hypothetical protein